MSDVTDTSVASPGTQPDNPTGDALPIPSTDSTGSTGSPQASSGQTPEALDRCVRCQADLTGDRRTARFCPRCGARRLDLVGGATPLVTDSDSPTPAFCDDLIASKGDQAAIPPPVPKTPDASQAAAWLKLSLSQAAGARTAGTPVGPPGAANGRSDNDGDVHSLMLLGYANAMYRLGWRYETGLGGGHNPQEALRCYFKAAKLGNIAALSRLAPQCVAAPAAPPPFDAPQTAAPMSGAEPPPQGSS